MEEFRDVIRVNKTYQTMALQSISSVTTDKTNESNMLKDIPPENK
jgi:hypothetical protein